MTDVQRCVAIRDHKDNQGIRDCRCPDREFGQTGLCYAHLRATEFVERGKPVRLVAGWAVISGRAVAVPR